MARKIRIGIPHGDINAIGYELIFNTFGNEEMFELCTPVVYGSPKVAAYHRNALGIQAVFTIISKTDEIKDGKLNLLTTIEEDLKIELGHKTDEVEKAAKTAIDRALDDLNSGGIDLLVLTPAPLIDGKTQEDYIASKLGQADKNILLLLGQNLNMAFATHNIALENVGMAISEQLIESKIKQLAATLQRDLRIGKPRLAVLSLNNAETQSNIDTQTVSPVIDKMRQEGINVYGPFSAENYFAQHQYQAFDATLALYDQQATTPFNCISAERGVYLLGGIDPVVTFAQTADRYANAGKNVEDVAPFRNAIFAAIDVYRHRNNFDEAHANPLPKLYHEKRDESEKVRFNVPKKQDATVREENK